MRQLYQFRNYIFIIIIGLIRNFREIIRRLYVASFTVLLTFVDDKVIRVIHFCSGCIYTPFIADQLAF